MKQLIFILVIFACGLVNCKRNQNAADKSSVKDVAQNANTDTSKLDVERISQSDTSGTETMYVEDSVDSTGLIFIRKFYEDYLFALENGFADSLIREYSTFELIDKLDSKELGYDPFLNAQDFDENLLKTFDVKKSDTPQDYYIASYVDGYSKKKIYIVMSLEQLERKYKINDIILGYEPEN